jgi:hypothetical protein
VVEAPGTVTGINPHAIASGCKKDKRQSPIYHAVGKSCISGETAVFRTALSPCAKIRPAAKLKQPNQAAINISCELSFFI